MLQLQGEYIQQLVSILPLLTIFAIFYFLVILPTQRQKQKQQQMLAGLKNGDVVVTTGGLVGSIVALNSDDTLVLRTKPDNVKLQFARSAVAALLNAEGDRA